MTAIDWFINNLPERFKNPIINTCQEEIAKAKEMEREQIEDAFQDGKWDWSDHITNGTESKDLAQYYNETYNK